MNQTHTQTTISIHKQTKRLYHNITNVHIVYILKKNKVTAQQLLFH